MQEICISNFEMCEYAFVKLSVRDLYGLYFERIIVYSTHKEFSQNLDRNRPENRQQHSSELLDTIQQCLISFNLTLVHFKH